jgi:hypothetical protein
VSAVLKSLVELVRASIALLMAKLTSRAHPCPPHDFTHGWNFCERCGRSRDELDDGAQV